MLTLFMLSIVLLLGMPSALLAQTTEERTGNKEPLANTTIFKITWLPPAYPDQCKPYRPWLRTVKSWYYGQTNFTARLNEKLYYDLQRDPRKNYTRATDLKYLSWHMVDPKGSIYQYGVDTTAYDYLERLGKQSPDFHSVGPDVKGYPASRVDKRYIFGADDRVRLPCGSQYYYPTSVVGKVTSGCSGTLIGPRHVLTAGHCVHSGGSSGDWYYDIKFQPQLNCPDQQVASYGWSQIYSVTGWTVNKDFAYDYALIVLSSSPNLGWMSFGYHTGISFWWNFNIRGYMSQDKPYYEIYNSYTTGLYFPGPYVLYHKIDIVKGTSGAMMYRYLSSSGSRVIYGIQSHHWCPSGYVDATGTKCSSAIGYSGATRITGNRFHQICGWINDPSVC